MLKSASTDTNFAITRGFTLGLTALSSNILKKFV